MNYSTGEIWLIISAMAVGTFAIRFSFLGMIGDRPMPPLVLRLLRYTPVAVLPGMVRRWCYGLPQRVGSLTRCAFSPLWPPYWWRIGLRKLSGEWSQGLSCFTQGFGLLVSFKRRVDLGRRN